MKKQTVHQLRKTGWKVKVGHKRLVYKFDPKTGIKSVKVCLFKDWQTTYPDFYMSAKGGFTEVCITSPEGITHTGFAFCSEEDHYNCTIGLDIALGRALHFFTYVS